MTRKYAMEIVRKLWIGPSSAVLVTVSVPAIAQQREQPDIVVI
jgi:hypothetical protein